MFWGSWVLPRELREFLQVGFPTVIQKRRVPNTRAQVLTSSPNNNFQTSVLKHQRQSTTWSIATLAQAVVVDQMAGPLSIEVDTAMRSSETTKGHGCSEQWFDIVQTVCLTIIVLFVIQRVFSLTEYIVTKVTAGRGHKNFGDAEALTTGHGQKNRGDSEIVSDPGASSDLVLAVAVPAASSDLRARRAIESMTVDEAKSVLKHQGESVAGTKDLLIVRCLASLARAPIEGPTESEVASLHRIQDHGHVVPLPCFVIRHEAVRHIDGWLADRRGPSKIL